MNNYLIKDKDGELFSIIVFFLSKRSLECKVRIVDMNMKIPSEHCKLK